ncbi:glycoside hydrolase family 13 protein [Microbispora rosea]|uniref:glycoside hydrolase family 13 protein n=1 Tax=Microbispora rosea TaxID=58117 RepID=UPI0034496858
MTAPAWVKDAIFYQVFPDRFARGAANDGARLEPWDSPPTPGGFKGGNLAGVQEKLLYLQELGVNTLYLNPIFRSSANHRYHTQDYLDVDPLLGGRAAFARLLQAAHARGMRIVLDGVFNHVGRGFYHFNHIVENGPHSPWLDWFTVHSWPIAPFDGSRPANYECWQGRRDLPTLNHANPEVREYLMTVAEWWTREGIDGWRLDVPDAIGEPGFWEEFRERVKAINPDAYLVGELIESSPRWLDGTRFDGLTNYEFCAATIMFVAGDKLSSEHLAGSPWADLRKIDAVEYGRRLTRLAALHPRELQLVQLNFVENHDTPRLLTLAGKDVSTVELATLAMATFIGVPCVYYGGEVGLEGGMDPDSRRTFPPPSDWNTSLLEHHRDLFAARRACAPLRNGSFRLLHASGDVIAFSRDTADTSACVVLNASDRTVRPVIPIGSCFGISPEVRRLFGKGRADLHGEWEERNLAVVLPQRSGLVVEISR